MIRWQSPEMSPRIFNPALIVETEVIAEVTSAAVAGPDVNAGAIGRGWNESRYGFRTRSRRRIEIRSGLRPVLLHLLPAQMALVLRFFSTYGFLPSIAKTPAGGGGVLM